MDNKKRTTLSVPSEKEITELYKRIQRNQSENKLYQKQLDRFFSGSMPTNEVITVCGTPPVLKLLDSKAKKIIINQSDLKNALADRHKGNNSDHTEPHHIDKDEIYKLPEQIRNPVMILIGNKRNDNSLVLITELKNSNGEHLIVPIALDRQNGKVSRITTIYGKKNLGNYFTANLFGILAINKEKADRLCSDIEFQLPKSTYELAIRYDDSIAYSFDYVKRPYFETKENEVGSKKK